MYWLPYRGRHRIQTSSSQRRQGTGRSPIQRGNQATIRMAVPIMSVRQYLLNLDMVDDQSREASHNLPRKHSLQLTKSSKRYPFDRQRRLSRRRWLKWPYYQVKRDEGPIERESTNVADEVFGQIKRPIRSEPGRATGTQVKQ
jgi:hypothetical protein